MQAYMNCLQLFPILHLPSSFVTSESVKICCERLASLQKDFACQGKLNTVKGNSHFELLQLYLRQV